MPERLRASWARRSQWTRSCSRTMWSSSAVGESLRLMALLLATSRMEAAWSRPSARRASASDRVAAESLVGGVEEGIVALHGMRVDGGRVGGMVAGDDGLGRLALAAGEAGLVAQRAHVPSAEAALDDGVGDGGGDVGLAVHVDQAKELLELAVEADAPPRHLVQVQSRLGADGDEPLAARGTAACLAAIEQLADVGGIFDVAVLVPAASVGGDLDAVAHDAQAAVVGPELDSLAHELGGDRVRVAVEAHARLLGDDEGNDDVGVEGVWRQRAQTGALDEQALGRALASGGVDALVGDLVTPAGGLGAQVVEAGKGAAVEEGVSDELDAGLDAALELGIAGGGGGGLEQVVAGEGEEARVELDGRAHVVQDDGFEIDVDHPARDAAEEFQRLAVHPAERLHLLVQGEVDEDGARPGQHHGEQGQRPLAGAHAQVAEAAPVDLGLLGGLELDAQVGLAAARLAHLGDVTTQMLGAAGVPAIAQLHEQPGRGQQGQLREALDDEGLPGL